MSKSPSETQGKKWVAPRSGGYAARSATNDRLVQDKAPNAGRTVTERVTKKSAPPPGGSSVAKAK